MVDLEHWPWIGTCQVPADALKSGAETESSTKFPRNGFSSSRQSFCNKNRGWVMFFVFVFTWPAWFFSFKVLTAASYETAARRVPLNHSLCRCAYWYLEQAQQNGSWFLGETSYIPIRSYVYPKKWLNPMAGQTSSVENAGSRIFRFLLVSLLALQPTISTYHMPFVALTLKVRLTLL